MHEPTPRAKKSLGQHFLHDTNSAQKIVHLLNIRAGDKVIEIGPGPGALTHWLIASPLKNLVLLEKDVYWARTQQHKASPQTYTILIDALHMAWERITPQCPYKIIGNLPYNVASPLMWDIFSQATGLVRAVFMVQKEVALRLVAPPGGKEYGALSVWVQSFVTPAWGFVVKAQAFSPPPKVDSAVVAFMPLPLARRPHNPQALGSLIKMCFQNRRKQMGTIFRQHGLHFWPDIAQSLHIVPTVRPEVLTPTQFADILCCMQHYS